MMNDDINNSVYVLMAMPRQMETHRGKLCNHVSGPCISWIGIKQTFFYKDEHHLRVFVSVAHWD